MEDIMVQTALAARVYLYRMFQAVFGDDPTEELLAIVFSDTTNEATTCFDGADADEYRAAVSSLAKCRGAFEANRAEYLEAAKRDYTHLLVGPEDLKAPPWECVHLTNERVLFQEATLKVREAYRSENMLPSGYPHVSDDHIAIELDFIAKLSEKARQAFDVGDVEEYRRLLEAQRTFVNEHPAKWAKKYAEALEDAAFGSLYSCMGALCAAFLPLDVEVIGELLEEDDK